MKLENIRIEILKDTPFHKAGDVLKLIDFRAVYGWICTSTTTNEQLINYLKTEWKLQQNQLRDYQKQIGDWFKVVELEDLEPLECIIDDIYYTKGFDGMYHMWVSPTHLKDKQSIGMISIPEMRKRIETSKFKKHILYCTNDVNKKL